VGVENDGRGARLAALRADERWKRCDQLLGEGRRSEAGGPMARGGGEGGDYGHDVGAGGKARCGGKNFGRRRVAAPF
jgi:hypothetical protein